MNYYYFKRNGEKVQIKGIKDLKKGDIVCVKSRFNKVSDAVVARVRTVECATIVTIKSNPDVYSTRFVGYHNGWCASNGFDELLSLDSYEHDRLSEAWGKVEDNTKKDASRAEALYAMKVLRNWLRGSDEQAEREFEYDDEL